MMMDSFDAFLDTQRLRIERLLRRETQSERINRELSRQAHADVDTPYSRADQPESYSYVQGNTR